jgi:HAD superfamily hydrolase (TIGR01484 family)
MASLRLLSTDFDGTLIGPSGEGCPEALAQILVEHHRQGGLWAVNTGRGLEHILEGLEDFSAPVIPDYLLVNERAIYRREGELWESHEEWNRTCRKRHDELNGLAGGFFGWVKEMADASDHTITIVYEDELPAGLITSDENMMEEVVLRVAEAARDVPGFAFQRNSIYMRFCHRDYHKGSSLRELCRMENLSPEEVFAVGDHFNDTSMLDGTHAGMTACPANAIEAVKETVRRAGGYLSEASWAHGVAEALRYYERRTSGRESTCA